MPGLYSRLPLETANHKECRHALKANKPVQEHVQEQANLFDAYLEETDERVAQPVIQPLYGSDQYVAQGR